MQQLSRQCCRLVPVVRHSTTPLVVREVLPAALAQTQNTSVAAQSHWLRGPSIWHNSQASSMLSDTQSSLVHSCMSQKLDSPVAGASFSTAASDGRDPTADNEPKLEPTLQQQKAALKPATGRNQFQRMWKKATQTRVQPLHFIIPAQSSCYVNAANQCACTLCNGTLNQPLCFVSF